MILSFLRPKNGQKWGKNSVFWVISMLDAEIFGPHIRWMDEKNAWEGWGMAEEP